MVITTGPGTGRRIAAGLAFLTLAIAVVLAVVFLVGDVWRLLGTIVTLGVAVACQRSF